jgi:hypothetical protein
MKVKELIMTLERQNPDDEVLVDAEPMSISIRAKESGSILLGAPRFEQLLGKLIEAKMRRCA